MHWQNLTNQLLGTSPLLNPLKLPLPHKFITYQEVINGLTAFLTGNPLPINALTKSNKSASGYFYPSKPPQPFHPPPKRSSLTRKQLMVWLLFSLVILCQLVHWQNLTNQLLGTSSLLNPLKLPLPDKFITYQEVINGLTAFLTGNPLPINALTKSNKSASGYFYPSKLPQPFHPPPQTFITYQEAINGLTAFLTGNPLPIGALTKSNKSASGCKA